MAALSSAAASLPGRLSVGEAVGARVGMVIAGMKARAVTREPPGTCAGAGSVVSSRNGTAASGGGEVRAAAAPVEKPAGGGRQATQDDRERVHQWAPHNFGIGGPHVAA